MRPPLHPALFFLSQSTSSCSDRDISSPVTILFIPSTAATVENAQQLPAHHKSLPINIIFSIDYFQFPNELSSFGLVLTKSQTSA